MLAIWGWRDPLVLVRPDARIAVAHSLLMLVIPCFLDTFHYNAALPRTPCLAIFGVAPLIMCALAAVCSKSAQTGHLGSRRRCLGGRDVLPIGFDYFHR